MFIIVSNTEGRVLKRSFMVKDIIQLSETGYGTKIFFENGSWFIAKESIEYITNSINVMIANSGNCCGCKTIQKEI